MISTLSGQKPTSRPGSVFNAVKRSKQIRDENQRRQDKIYDKTIRNVGQSSDNTFEIVKEFMFLESSVCSGCAVSHW
jgi:hypothetical protein